jgi:hypothetical protein
MPSRRAVTKVAAWSAPVIAAAAAAPMAAASGNNAKNGHIFWNTDSKGNSGVYNRTGDNTFRIWADTPGGKAYAVGDSWTIDLSASSLRFTGTAGSTFSAGVPYPVTVTIVNATTATVVIAAGGSFSYPNFTDVLFPSGSIKETPTGTFTGKINVAPTSDPSLSNALSVNV